MTRRIDLNNKYRVLLTEVLPYELPLMLDNEGFYLNMQNESLRQLFKETFAGMSASTIPLDYSIRRYGGDKSRKLSVMHPCTQLEWVDFYEKYDSYMLALCNNSPFSIRYIANRAKCIFNVEEERAESDEGEQDGQKRVEVLDDGVEKLYRSYFSYKRYDMLYKFFGSGDYLRLEQKYCYMQKMDVARCFYHIYTHTISWAVKGKEYAKQNKTGTFEAEFDRLIRNANYEETCGIIVGPEISRIFAEIIFQRIDLNVLNRLKEEPYSLKLGRDYEVRRYLDDHYIYANTEDNLKDILEVYNEELMFYKLFVNESKLETMHRPFVSSLSDAKHGVNTIISGIATKWLAVEDGKYIRNVKNEMKAFSSVVTEFRSLAHRCKQGYGALNRYFLTILISQIKKEMGREVAKSASNNLLFMYSEIAFYVFSLDMSISASIKLCRIIDCLHKWAKKCSDTSTLPDLENRILRETKRCLCIYEAAGRDGDTNIEVMNLLLCLNNLMNTPMTRTNLNKCFNIGCGKAYEYNSLNYFQICTLLYIIGRDRAYTDVRSSIVVEIKRRLSDQEAIRHADNAMLLLDTMVCPYISKVDKKDILMSVLGCSENTAYTKLKAYNAAKRWFFNWDKSLELTDWLGKKEYHSPYE